MQSNVSRSTEVNNRRPSKQRRVRFSLSPSRSENAIPCKKPIRLVNEIKNNTDPCGFEGDSPPTEVEHGPLEIDDMKMAISKLNVVKKRLSLNNDRILHLEHSIVHLSDFSKRLTNNFNRWFSHMYCMSMYQRCSLKWQVYFPLFSIFYFSMGR